MRVILNNGTRCSNNCAGCYYGWRSDSGPPIPNLLSDIVDRYDSFAVGINNGARAHDFDVVLSAINKSYDVVVTINSTYELSSGGGMHIILPNAAAICVSYNGTLPPTNDELEFMRIVGRTSRRPILNVVSNEVYDSSTIDNIKVALDALGTGEVYALMRKGPPDLWWKMTNALLESYGRWIDTLRSSGITPNVDECVMGVLSNDIGNCNREWIEVTSSGEVRSCPYTSSPDTYISGVEELNPLSLGSCRCVIPTNMEDLA